MNNPNGKTAVVTGASQGIGRAIALRLAEQRVDTILAGRRERELLTVRDEILATGGNATTVQVDFADLGSIRRFVERISADRTGIDILVNCAGIYMRGSWNDSLTESFEQLLDTNVRGVFAVTQGLLPLLIRSQGDIVFVNSSVVYSDGQHVAHYAACQHARKALADALRAEANEKGVRVLSVFPGRTATPMQKAIYDAERRDYRPERLLQADDVARAVVSCLQLPSTAEVTELRIRPRYKQ